MYQKVIYTLVNPINRQNIYICRCFINAHFQNCQLYHVCVTSRLKSVCSTASVHLFLAERGMPAEYAFDQLMGFLDPLKFGQFA